MQELCIQTSLFNKQISKMFCHMIFALLLLLLLLLFSSDLQLYFQITLTI